MFFSLSVDQRNSISLKAFAEKLPFEGTQTTGDVMKNVSITQAMLERSCGLMNRWVKKGFYKRGKK